MGVAVTRVQQLEETHDAGMAHAAGCLDLSRFIDGHDREVSAKLGVVLDFRPCVVLHKLFAMLVEYGWVERYRGVFYLMFLEGQLHMRFLVL